MTMKKNYIKHSFLGLAITASLSGFSQAQLLQDINPGAADADILGEFIEFQGDLYFAADDGTNGKELWKYNGNFTSLVANINTTPGGDSDPRNFHVHNDTLFFQANNGINGRELYYFDGANLNMQNLNPEPTGPIKNSSPGKFVSIGNDLYFTATNAFTRPNEVHKFNPSGSIEIDLDPTEFSQAGAFESIEYNGALYLSAKSNDYGYELWKIEGTTPTLIEDIVPGTAASTPRFFHVFNNNLYFSANDGTNGRELYKYDGNSVSLIDINPSGSSNPGNFFTYNNAMYFQADDGVNGIELWKYNGISPVLIDINTSGSSFPGMNNAEIYDNKLFFTARDDNSSGTRQQWWRIWNLWHGST